MRANDSWHMGAGQTWYARFYRTAITWLKLNQSDHSILAGKTRAQGWLYSAQKHWIGTKHSSMRETDGRTDGQTDGETTLRAAWGQNCQRQRWRDKLRFTPDRSCYTEQQSLNAQQWPASPGQEHTVTTREGSPSPGSERAHRGP